MDSVRWTAVRLWSGGYGISCFGRRDFDGYVLARLLYGPARAASYRRQAPNRRAE